MKRNLLKAVVSLILAVILCATGIVPFAATQTDVTVQPIEMPVPAVTAEDGTGKDETDSPEAAEQTVTVVKDPTYRLTEIS